MLPLSSFGSRWGRVLLVVLLLAATLGTARAQAVPPGQGLVADTTELRVLRELYAATGGPQWTRHGHWPATPAAWQAATLDSAKTWYGVDVDAGDVFRLNLGGNHLQGELPAGLGRLAALRELYLGSNQLGGALPASLGRMRQLGALIANANQLSGPLPDSLGRCTALYVLYLNQNQLSGALPTWLGRLTALQQLGLDHNQFSGQLPATLANCQYLWMLNLADNQLDGPIPGAWGRLRSSQIFLSRNRLSGALPDSLALITNLEYLDAENNRFTGPIPAAYKRFKRLNRLNLADNQLTGSIPDSLKAAFLLLLNNHLSGELPASYGTTHNWQILLDGNNITRIPRFLQPLGYPNLQLGLTNNYLQFDSYEPNQVIPGQWQFWDYGQRPPAPADTLERVVGTAAALNGAIGGAHNHYQWQRQDARGAWADLPGQIQPTLEWAALAPSDAGQYRTRVTNDWVVGITLYSRTLPVRINQALTHLPPSNPSDDLNRNWAIERTFDDDGNVIAESKHFSDGLGRPTQSQARNVANGNVFAAQTIYSSGGQAVLHTLAAPINNQAFRYQEHFVTATTVPAGGNTPVSRDYGPDNFEGAKASNPDPLDESTAGTLGNYYSEQNLLEPLTPAAHNPYSLVEAYEGPWGGMKRSAAPGDNFRMGLGHEARSREIPVRKEFDPYLSLRPQFVPGSPLNTLEYQGTKTVSIDHDGREAIVVSNKDGQTLVTCLSGPQYPAVDVFGFISAGPNTSDDPNAPAFQDVHIPAAGPVEVTFTVGDWVRVKNLQTGDSTDYEITPRGPSPGIRVTLQPGFYRFISLGGTQWFSYQAHYGNFSYTYYDDAGRVVATVAPNGLAQKTTTPTGNPTAGLVGTWGFNEGSGTVAGDGSGNALTGALVNQPEWDSPARTGAIPPSPAGGSCLVFNGISYVRVGNPPDLRLSTTMSMEAWIYPTANRDGIVLNKENEYEMQRFADGSIQCAFQNARPGWAWINTGVVAPLNTWSHIAITYDNGVVTTYLNGQPAGAVFQGAGAISAASGGEFWIGGRSCCGYYFPGAIDEVHVWNTVHAPNGLVAANNAPGVNLVKNPSFDLEVRTAQTGAYWNTARDWQSEGDVQDVFTEDYGVAHSGVMHETHYSQSGSPYHVITHQLISNLPSGSYNLRAWVKGSGGQPVARMFARNFGGGEVGATILPTPGGPTGAWALLEVNGIQVTTGQCDIAFESTANRGGQFIYFDDVVFEPVTDNAHSQYVTRNTYNSLSNLLSTETTDAGRTEYVYARDGRVRFSQNALQRPVGRYAYSNYDELGRVVESGEYTPGQYAVNVFENHLTAIPASNSVLQTSILESRSRTGGLYPNWCAQRQQSWYDLPWDGSNGSQGNDSQLNGRKQEFILASVAKTSNDKVTTWYSYDEIGRVTWVVQDIVGIGIKTLDYKYDFNGNVLEVAYQNGQPDAFHHYYEYDAAKRLYKVYTSSDGVARILQAKYTYYLHGPLKRVELANRLQGLDYAYTMQGWLKSINHVNERLDMGADSPAANGVPKDLFALTLDYFSGDYRSRSLNVMTPTGLTSATNPYRYDGTIRASSWRTAASPDHQQMVYAYDEKSQLKQSTYGKLGISGAYYHFDVAANKAFEEGGLDYDPNGNIQSLRRTDQAGTVTDNFTYKYAANTNKLTEVHSGGATGPTVLDYDYDALGQMTRQRDEQGQRYLTYDVSGKTTGVYLDAAHQQPVVEFAYDDRGFRVSKKSYGRGTSAGQVRTTYYVRDMAGNVLSVYEQGPQTGNAVQRSEVPLYGSGRLGTLTRLDDGSEDYRYELTDNLGDSRVVFHKPTTEALTETMELSGVSSRAAFQNDNLYRAALSGAPSGIYVAQFSDTQAPGTELKRTLTVEKGDTITFSAIGLLQDQAAGLSGAQAQPYLLLGAAATSDENAQRGLDGQPSVARTSPVKWLGRIAAGLSFPIGQRLKNQNAAAQLLRTTTLQGWIKYRVLDAQGNEVSTRAEYLTGTGTWESIRLGVRVQQGGSVEVIAGSTGQGSAIYFDNLTVEQTGGMIVQEQHQYAYGSPLVGLNYTVGSKSYRHGYQGLFAEKDNETGWDSFELRLYNSRIGRWMTYDPYGQFSSPYVGMGNEPVAGIDPDGGWKPKLPKFRGAKSAVVAASHARFGGKVVGRLGAAMRGGSTLSREYAKKHQYTVNPLNTYSRHTAASDMFGDLFPRAVKGMFGLPMFPEHGDQATFPIIGPEVEALMMLEQYNSYQSVLEEALNLAAVGSTKATVRTMNGIIYGDGQAILQSITRGGRMVGPGRYLMSDGTFIGGHISTGTVKGLFTIDINHAGIIYKIRIL